MPASNKNRDLPSDFTQRHATLIAFALVCIATVGYFLGLSSPMTSTEKRPSRAEVLLHAGKHDPAMGSVIPAASYAEMASVRKHPTFVRSTLISSFGQQGYDPLAKIEVREADKMDSLADRKTRRAFNGAPPTVPHSVNQLDSIACMACHGEGLQASTLRASKIPHPYYSSCTQCHVEQRGTFTLASASFENSFEGAEAPTHGVRAYPSAPPLVPHSTWMRNDCLSCHGRTAALGMASTHPWRKGCLQCHGESSQLNQIKIDATPQFLPGPTLLDNHE